MDVVVFGGSKTYFEEVMRPLFRKAGTVAVSHVPWTQVDADVPDDAKGVVLVADAVAFDLKEKVRRQVVASKAHLAYAEVVRGRSPEPVLRMFGFLPPAEKSDFWTEADIAELARLFVEDCQRRRLPAPPNSVTAAVRRGLGPKVVIPEAVLAAARAAARVAANPFLEAARKLVWEFPELSEDELVARLSSGRSIAPEDVTREAAREARREFDDLLRTRSRSPSATRQLTECRARWLTRYAEAYRAEHGQLPGYDAIDAASAAVFGGTMDHTAVRPVLDSFRRTTVPEAPPSKDEDKAAPTRADRVRVGLKVARDVYDALRPDIRTQLGEWVRTGAHTTPSPAVKDLGKLLVGKPTEAVAVLRLAHGTETAPVRESFVRAYRVLTGRNLGPRYFEEVLGALVDEVLSAPVEDPAPVAAPPPHPTDVLAEEVRGLRGLVRDVQDKVGGVGDLERKLDVLGARIESLEQAVAKLYADRNAAPAAVPAPPTTLRELLELGCTVTIAPRS